MTAGTVSTVEVPAYRPFAVRAVRVQRLSPAFVRVTFGGADLDEFRSGGRDQRIKVVLPRPDTGLTACPRGGDWYGEWRALPPGRRNPVRTYTVRAARPERYEVDVDFVLHDGAIGPAARWAQTCAVGSEAVLIGPNARFPGDCGGVEWRPPTGAPGLLLAGDETAVPAVCAIVEQLPRDARGRVFLEVPTIADVLPVQAPAGAQVTWLPRRSRVTDRPRGELLTGAVLAALPPAPAVDPAVEDASDDEPVVWDVPHGIASAPTRYVWLAGEARVVTGLRRRLLADAGLDRSAVAFMGYWREGRAAE
jgi:NADPH-dependent ferric siderophore reductase